MKGIEVTAKRQIKWWHILIIVLTVVALILASMLIWVTSYVKKNFNYSYNDITSNPADLGFEEVKRDDIVNIALFGIDTHEVGSFDGRSDSIIVLSVNKTTKKIKLISIMRDTFAPIENDGEVKYARINEAYEDGGPTLAIKTINTLYGLDISEYATVNFFGMADIIDAVGGVEVEVFENELKHLNDGVISQCDFMKISHNKYLLKSAGQYTLNGIQAVAYSRIRWAENANGNKSDFGRTDRQRYVLEQLFNKALVMDTSRYIDLIKALSPCCETSLSYTEMLDFALDVLLYKPTFEQSRVPQKEYLMEDPLGTGIVVYYDFEFASTLIHEFIYNDMKPEDYIAANGVIKNDWYAELKN